MDIFIAFIILIFTNGEVSQKHVSFYSLKDCNRYLEISKKENKVGDTLMVMDDNLVWTFNKIQSIVTYCKKSELKVNK